MKKKTKIVGLFLMITLLFFVIPGFGKVQASREDDVFDGWQSWRTRQRRKKNWKPSRTRHWRSANPENIQYPLEMQSSKDAKVLWRS